MYITGTQTASTPGGRGDSHIKMTGILVGEVELTPAGEQSERCSGFI